MKRQPKQKETKTQPPAPSGSKREVAVLAVITMISAAVLLRAAVQEGSIEEISIALAVCLITSFHLGRDYERVKRDEVTVWIDAGE